MADNRLLFSFLLLDSTRFLQWNVESYDSRLPATENLLPESKETA